MKTGEAFVYLFEGTPYINLTNRCCNDCAFCLRANSDGVGGDSLWLAREPDADEVIGQLETVLAGSAPIREVVFCGFGEPTNRLDVLLTIAEYAKCKGLHTRLNTNGLGSLICGRDITGELASVIDTVSVSLNASDAARYVALCKPEFGLASFDALLTFSKACVNRGMKTVLSIVDSVPPEEVEACRRIAEGLGAEFRVRTMIK